MICKRCFRMSDDGFEYCPYCGKSFSDDSEIEVKHDHEPDKIDTIPQKRDDDPAYRPDSVPQGERIYDYTMPPRMTVPPYVPPVEREKSPVQKFMSAIGHAALYFALFFMCQTIISTAYMSVLSARVSSEMMEDIIESGRYEDIYSDEFIEMVSNAIYDEIDSTDTAVIGIISSVLTLLILFLIAKMKSRPFSEHTGFYPVRTWKVLLLLPLGIAAQFLVTMIVNLVPWPEWAIEQFNETYSYIGQGSGAFAFIVELLSVVIFAPLIEELIFRGCIYTRLRRGMPANAAMILSAFAFGLAHGVLIAVCYATALGLMLAYTYRKFDSVLASITLHLGFNLANYIPLMREDSTGGEIILTLVLSAVVFVICSSVIILSDVSRKKRAEESSTNYPNYPNFPEV